jgi:hypothetical protein
LTEVTGEREVRVMAIKEVKINNIAGFVVADPFGGVEVTQNIDTVRFDNATGHEIRLYFADSKVLKTVGQMKAITLAAGATSKDYDVIAAPGQYEYVVLFKTESLTNDGKKHRGGASHAFATGGSTPRIVVR